MKLQELAQLTTADFRKSFNRDPQWIAAAPGRVNVIGEHTDYNDGFVLPMAIDRYTVIAASPNGSDKITLRSASGNGTASVDLSQPLRPGPRGYWANYPMGVIAGFLARGHKPAGFDAVLHSTVPLGGGLSSSAALEVATATLLEIITGQKLDPVEKALLCQKAEHDYAGMPCGIMDQFISVMGKENHLLLLDCRSRRPELVPMSDPAMELLIINTNVKHELTGGEYAKRRAQCEQAARILRVASLRDATADQLERSRSGMEDVVFRRARHVIGEIERTPRAAEKVRASNWPAVGELMYASHASLRDDYEVSCPELDAVVEIARAIGPQGGVIGCRMTGGGFGGCAVALVRADKVGAISERVAAEYEQRTKIKPSLFVSRPAAGATVLRT
ncbi:MAG TPA: galactokinase [Candidatus Paceibacterota bacterium]|nr:galactokinase [Verrucomicrobiota bacterium]HSA12643.1 galactokinase [Candidatus Paceibacterota bacterium]